MKNYSNTYSFDLNTPKNFVADRLWAKNSDTVIGSFHKKIE